MVTRVERVEEVSRYTSPVGFGGFIFKTIEGWFGGLSLKTIGGRFGGLGLKTIGAKS
jgi:hypothetical protein